VMDSAGYDRAGRSLSDSLRALEAGGARKFIIDLRLSGEGAEAPVTEGLSSLLGDGRPVVVLRGHGTSGVGERVAIAFKGRKQTWLIGERTAGSAAGTVCHWIVNGQIGVIIGETMPVDRKHRSYPRNLIPDEWVPGGDDFSDQEKDKKMQAALQRLGMN